MKDDEEQSGCDDLSSEISQSKSIAISLGDPSISPDFKPLIKKIDQLYCQHMPIVMLLHALCDRIKIAMHDYNQGAMPPLYPLISVLYLINPRHTLPILIDFLSSDDSAVEHIKDNARRLGLTMLKTKEEALNLPNLASEVSLG
ncbi:hypothetical protein [Piscirickettsia litoralis]|uniref:DUF5071 domain-containing protein n=1 Tax=Piscirickettsia litoralis TaxID=1891921 RepID=A0ABX3A8X1_9GAMM|nr:hypothetical protein [Piscirickettsia litoralis]ODN43885.1 hypothetical protein BGC07_14545 [Piscirickettsia litoralis]